MENDFEQGRSSCDGPLECALPRDRSHSISRFLENAELARGLHEMGESRFQMMLELTFKKEFFRCGKVWASSLFFDRPFVLSFGMSWNTEFIVKH
mmetsp:Transcript_32297/g.80447  ORF Transcript_32297/g.80447 Transcript_32297/m.80447 type:complete len:95 (+) Transcript_32297:1108-1392(+)